MTAASFDPDPDLFSVFSNQKSNPTRRDTFALSFLGQAAILAVIVYLTSFVIGNGPAITTQFHPLDRLPLIFSGQNGGGGGNFDPLPASSGTPPRASLERQIVPPTVIVPKEMPRLPVEETVIVAPEVKFPQASQIGDAASPFSQWRSDGPGGPNGIGTGCCNGIGPSTGPGVGPGPSGIYPAGKLGVSVPQVIYSPEPSFSDEARKSKTQGVVTLMVVVGKDGRTHDLRVRQSLGMGLDEKAIEAVKNWRFRPAMLNGQPVASQIAVEVDFRLY
ncbi:MAG TPA: energy transducer TonB [Candidatus Sulfotelmatobacter sp.]|jgi:TonB family protein